MTSIVVSSRVGESIVAVHRQACALIPGLRETNTHRIDGDVVVATFEVPPTCAPASLTDVCTLRESTSRLIGFAHRVGDIRWVVTGDSQTDRALLEVDLHALQAAAVAIEDVTEDGPGTRDSDDDEEGAVARAGTALVVSAPPGVPEAACGKRRRTDETTGATVVTRGAVNVNALAVRTYTAVRSAQQQAHQWMRRALASLDADLADARVEETFMRSLDACRVPRIRAPAVRSAIRHFESAIRAARVTAGSRVSLALRPALHGDDANDDGSACACIHVFTQAPLTVRVHTLARLMATAEDADASASRGLHFSPRVFLCGTEIYMALHWLRPSCELHRSAK